jgi:hypothetical protein
MTFQITGLPHAAYAHLIGLPEAELAARGAVRMTAETPHSFPCRVGLRDLDPGETAILVNHTHQPATTPFQASHAIFVGEGSVEAAPTPGEIPDALARRTLSVRSFDDAGMMLDADLAEGADVAPLIERLLAEPRAAYADIHYARRGCWAGRARRILTVGA